MAQVHERLGMLAAPERTRLLRLLELEELAVGEIARIVQLPQSTVSRHLKALEDAGWVVARRDGTARLFALADLPSDEAALWALVKAGTDGEHADDGIRLAGVIAAREPDPRRFFGRVAEGWAEVRRDLFGDAYLLPTLLALLPSDLVVADLGCGTGEVIDLLAPAVRRVIGVDREPAMLGAARRRLGGLGNVDLRLGALEDDVLGVDEVDVALFMLTLHHVEVPASALAAAARGLRCGGRIVVLDMVEHEREVYRRTMGHVHLGFSPDGLASVAADAGLRVVSWRALPVDLTATGPSLFLAVLARSVKPR